MNLFTLDELVQLPWTRRGPVKDSQAGEEFYKITIDELPAFVVVGSTPYEVITNVDRTLRVFLSSRLENGLPIPTPGQPTPASSPPPADPATGANGQHPTQSGPPMEMQKRRDTDTAPASPPPAPPNGPDVPHPADQQFPSS
ncbi:MAG: hypothetical protein O7I93_09305 [Gemmatimonadetes bacterium]|nr:hypothetical protein [Gemmatimonadota bacterium]